MLGFESLSGECLSALEKLLATLLSRSRWAGGGGGECQNKGGSEERERGGGRVWG